MMNLLPYYVECAIVKGNNLMYGKIHCHRFLPAVLVNGREKIWTKQGRLNPGLRRGGFWVLKERDI